MWNLLREALRRNDLTKNREWRETIDRYHFIERLAAVLEAFLSGGPRSEEAPCAAGPDGKKGLWLLLFDDKLGCS